MAKMGTVSLADFQSETTVGKLRTLTFYSILSIGSDLARAPGTLIRQITVVSVLQLESFTSRENINCFIVLATKETPVLTGLP